MSVCEDRIAGRWLAVACNEEGDYWVRDDLAHDPETACSTHAGFSSKWSALVEVGRPLMEPIPWEPYGDGDPDDGLGEVDPLTRAYEPQEVRRYVRFTEVERRLCCACGDAFAGPSGTCDDCYRSLHEAPTSRAIREDGDGA